MVIDLRGLSSTPDTAVTPVSCWNIYYVHNSMNTILITGANRGIGKEIARQMAALGWKVFLGARKISAGKEAAKEIDGDVIPIKLDVSSRKSMEEAAAEIKTHAKQLDVLVNNAGIMSKSTNTDTADLDDVRKTMDTNFFGAWETTQILLPLIRKSKEGRIINMSSGMGAHDDLYGGYAGYRMSKVAMNGLTILMANELKSENMKVNAMCPGWVRTDMGGMNAHRSVEHGAETAVWLATTKKIPTGKFFRDREVIPW